MERRGIPTVTVCTDRFRVLGELERRSLGIPELPMAIAIHPFGGLKADAVETKADLLLDQVVDGLTSH
tara:strand:+ start:549 stop:752 length:204 start_codon:yes stop_codon:yes gene_type:complete